MNINLNKYNIKKLTNKTKLNNQKLQIFELQKKKDRLIKRDELKNICDALRKDLSKKYGNGIISVSIKYPNRWYSGDVSYLNDDINYFSMDDYDEFDEDPLEYQKFRFQFIPINTPEGGKDKNNDCLMNCIKKCVQQRDCIYGEGLKNYLGLERDAMIPIDMMPQVEEYINSNILQKEKYAIMVSGEEEYISPINTNKIIRLILSSNHYSLDTKSITVVKGKAFSEKQILIYEVLDDEYNVYDGESEYTIDRDQYTYYNNNPNTCEYILVHKNYTNKVKKLSIEESYNEFIKMANEMKEKTDGKINFFKTGTVKKTALNYFYELTKSVQPEPISNNEAKWIENASFSALTYWEPFKGTVYSYDRNSHYPNTMTKNFHYFPIKEGEFKIVKSLNNLEFGIYRCFIDGPKTKFFKYNPMNYYTNIDIDNAIKNNLTVELIQDNKPNALVYTKDKLMNGAFLFKKYVTDLYELKSNGVKGSKDLLNMLWGSLCEMNHYKTNSDFDEEVNICEADMKHILSDENGIKLKYIFYRGGYYKTNFARIKPFVLAYGRADLMMFKEYEDQIVRIHTDGFYLKTKPENIKTGTNLGYLKYEGEKDVHIRRLNQIKIL